MHDPMTVAFELRYPWRAHRNPRNDFEREYREPWLVVWHRDPCVGGDDNSCGYVFPRVSREENDLALGLGRSEYPFMFGADHATLRGASTFEVVYAIWRILLWRMPPEMKRDRLTQRELRACFDVASAPMDNFQSHVERAKASAEECAELFSLVWRLSRRERRRWWQHPRFHLHHWRFQVYPWQTLRRWLFSRCQGCGERFAWGYSPLSTSWDPAPPRAFRSETHVYHFECAPRIQTEVRP